MRKLFLTGASLLAFSLFQPAGRAVAGDDWEWWLYTPASCRPAQEVKIDVTGMFRWKNDMKDYFYRSVISGGYYTPLPWLNLGAHYWYKESRSTTKSDWVYTNTLVGQVNLTYKLTRWLTLKESNRIEYDNLIYRWKLRVKPGVEFPLAALGLKPVKLYLDNEFFFAFDYEDDRDTYSENRLTAGVNVKIKEPLAVAVAYRNVGKKSASTDKWSYTNVLATYAKLAF